MPSEPSPSSGRLLATKTFLLTVSVRGDISPECIDALVKHIDSTTVHCYVVTEHGESGKLHLHAVLVYKKGRLAKKLHENIWDRQVKPHHPDSIGRIAVKVQVCPGHDWYDTYLKKEQDVTVVLDRYPREEVTPYFPEPAVQQALVELHQAKGKKSCNEWWNKHAEAWTATTFVNTPEGAHEYLEQCWLDGTSPRITDPRRSTQIAMGLYRHRNKLISCTERVSWLLKQLEDGPSYDAPAPARAGPSSAAPPSI